MFSYPIGIQLFNRPDYATILLESLSNQSLPVNENKVYICIDGYPESSYQKRGILDSTQEVARIARNYFPNCHITIFTENLGISALHHKLQTQVFSTSHSWATFLEEDLELNIRYLEELDDLISICDDFPEIAKVSCSQVIPNKLDFDRGYESYYPGRGTQAFAERSSFFYSRKNEIEAFIELINQNPKLYGGFKNSHLGAALALKGHFISYMQHDSLIESILHRAGKLHVATKPYLVKDIGIEGEHNYTTPHLNVDHTENITKGEIQDEKLVLGKLLLTLFKESEMYLYENYKTIYDGFYLSKSRKSMIKYILKSLFQAI